MMDNGWSLHEREPQKADSAPPPPGAPAPGPASGPAYPVWTGPPAGMAAPSQDEKNMAMLVHFLAFAGIAIPVAGNVLGPLVLWMMKKDQSPYIDFHGKQALNFNISVVIYGFVSAVLALLVIGIFMLIALVVFWLIATILWALKASNGEWAKYPLAIEFLK